VCPELATGSLRKLDADGQRRVLRYLRERITGRDDPRPLRPCADRQPQVAQRYRASDYGIGAAIWDDRFAVLGDVGHRREVYR